MPSPRRPPHWQTALLFLAILPFWTNYLIRTYAWIVLLNPAGLINSFLLWLGLIARAAAASSTTSSPSFWASSTITCPSSSSPSIRRCSGSIRPMPRPRAISAPAPWTTFWRITLPLTAPGVAAGAVFVFVLSIGNFVTPDLLGGGKFQMVGNLIYDQFLTARDWPFGSALSVILIAIMLILLFAQAIVASRSAGRESGVHA